MRAKTIFRYVAIALVVLLSRAVIAQAQEKREPITVESAQVGSQVVIILILAQSEKVPIELQCTKGYFACTALKPGEYIMVRLPKNQGLYECSNVTVYTKSGDSGALGEELGRYCINEK